MTVWNNTTAKVLSPGLFLICGDRAWQGIPRNPLGGPCYIGKLTIFSPRHDQLGNLSQALMKVMTSKHDSDRHKVKRSIKHLTEDCGDEVRLLDLTAHIFASILPTFGTAHALKEIERLACWSVKQANATSQLLSELLMDVEGVRHAVLQNRAAIDFLLLAQGHGSQDFDGMCCFNLSDHSKSMHKKLDWLKEHVNKIGIEDDPLGSWLSNLFGGIGPWLKHILIVVGSGIIVVLLIMLCLPCLLQCLQRGMQQMMQAMFHQQEEYRRMQARL
ncbi:syncytin-A-like [Cyrtonyx montezumae]|uniref:syncytin-A-like n=1 Tax=Cyrtonyx montezumae TaxID=9017 RepID=UPI0032DBEFC3